MPDARRSGRPVRVTLEPDGRQWLVYTFKDRQVRLWHPWLRVNCVLRVMLPTPWHATQRAAWEVLKKAETSELCAVPPCLRSNSRAATV